MNAEQLAQQMLNLCKQLDDCQAELEACVKEEVAAERAYGIAKSAAYLGTSGTVGEREAHTTKAVADERYRAHLAEGLSKSALEAVRSKRAQLSACQTLVSAHKEEAKLARYGPEMTP